jgi:hypothetical protein
VRMQVTNAVKSESAQISVAVNAPGSATALKRVVQVEDAKHAVSVGPQVTVRSAHCSVVGATVVGGELSKVGAPVV